MKNGRPKMHEAYMHGRNRLVGDSAVYLLLSTVCIMN